MKFINTIIETFGYEYMKSIRAGKAPLAIYDNENNLLYMRKDVGEGHFYMLIDTPYELLFNVWKTIEPPLINKLEEFEHSDLSKFWEMTKLSTIIGNASLSEYYKEKYTSPQVYSSKDDVDFLTNTKSIILNTINGPVAITVSMVAGKINIDSFQCKPSDIRANTNSMYTGFTHIINATSDDITNWMLRYISFFAKSHDNNYIEAIEIVLTLIAEYVLDEDECGIIELEDLEYQFDESED